MSGIRERSVVRSPVIPSTKYCCSGSLLKLAKGSTTTDRGAAGVASALGAAGGSLCGGRLAGSGSAPIVLRSVEVAADACAALGGRGSSGKFQNPKLFGAVERLPSKVGSSYQRRSSGTRPTHYSY